MTCVLVTVCGIEVCVSMGVTGVGFCGAAGVGGVPPATVGALFVQCSKDVPQLK